MRSADGLADLLPGALTWAPVVESYYGGVWLASVPVASGSVTWSTGRDVPGSLDLTVPRLTSGFDWRPGLDPRHPLGRFGQTLRVSVRVTSEVSRRVWVLPLGVFLVTATQPDEGDVRVTGASMMQRVVDDRLMTPTPTRAGATLYSELRRILPASLPLSKDAALADRTCPAMSWGESRIDAVTEIADAWPARLRETPQGAVRVLAPLPDVPTPLATLTDGEGGTVVSAYESDSRDGVFNRVVARGQETDDRGMPTVQAVAEVTSGPLSTRGPYGAVTMFHSSPLYTSKAAALSGARKRLADVTRRARTVPVTLAPDPRWELDDAVAIEADGQSWWGYVSGLTIPLTVEDGDQRMDIEVA